MCVGRSVHGGVVGAQVGLDHIDIDTAHASGLAVENVVVSTEEVADHAMALVLAAIRRIVPVHQGVEQGQWEPMGIAGRLGIRRLRGQVLGIIGAGRVGKAVAARALPFGFEILASSRHPRLQPHRGTLDSETATGINHVSLDELLGRSDVIVVCADSNPSSIGLLGADAFEKMKDGVVLVNVSRGTLIDEHALLSSLDSGKVSYAALDVRDPEPPDPEADPLRGRERVIQTHHVAGASLEARADLHRMTAARALEMLSNAGLVELSDQMPDAGIDVDQIHHIDELEDIARGRLPDATYGYVAGGAGRERSVSRNRESLDALRLVPRVMRDMRDITTSVPVLGWESTFPLIVAPSAVQRLSHADGELATARAARDAGLTMILSMNASTTMEDVAAEGVNFWMQLYFSSDRGHMASVIERAEEAGAKALCITVDHAGMPSRLRELHRPLVVPPEVEFVHLAKDPSLRGIDRGVTWDVIEWMRGISSLPIVLKGLLHPEDGRIAREMEVDGVIVSNHGGRQLDGAISAYDVLADFVEIADGDIEIYADGGIRSGTDLLKMLALGARAGLIGRPVWWGLAAAGQRGVERVLELVSTDLEESMRLCGIDDASKVSNEILFDGV